MFKVKYVLWVACLGIVPLVVRTCSPAIQCITSDSRETCEDRGLYYKENVRFGNCCPGCVPLPGEGAKCIDECAPGLSCNNETLVCEEDINQACEMKRRSAGDDDWKPDCLPDGTYAPKQCKGEFMSGRCFCFSPDGHRIFGEEKWSQAENMTCGCSRYFSQAILTRPDLAVHCNSQGNYELLQCDDGICWCAEEKTGSPYSIVVPDKMLKLLPCYDEKMHGNKYLRKCDSQRTAQNKARTLMSVHGTNNLGFSPVDCGFDGSFSKVQIRNNKKICTAKDGSSISQWTTDLNDSTVNCNCEYDRFVATGSFMLECEQNGNYMKQQHDGLNIYCVDEDGFNTKC